MTLKTRWFTLLGVMGLSLFLLASKARSADWWESSPYYNEDEWYDPTDWFDGNNYEFDQEAYDSYTAGADTASTNNSGASDYDYDYGYDNRGDVDYDNDWFYDFYDDGYASYHDYDDDGTYDFYYRYYDYDDDGSYDAYFAYTDTDDDGLYDDFDYYSFNDVSEQNRRSSQKAQSRQSKGRRVSGTVASTKRVMVRDAQHMIATVNQQNGKQLVVDLGPVSEVRKLDLRKGDRISARGPAVLVGDKRIMIAQQVQSSGQTAQINRSGRQLNGTIARIQNPSVSGERHRLVTLDLDDGRQVLVDLGPAKNLQNLELSEGDQLTVSGPMVRVQDRRVVMARQVTTEDGRHAIDRQFDNAQGQERQQASASSRDRQISGEVLSTSKATVRGTERMMAEIRTDDGNRVTVDLGPVRNLNQSGIQISQGDQITASGLPLRVEGERVLVARELQSNDQSVQINRMQR